MARDDHNEHTVVQRTDPLLGGVVANRFRIKEKIAAGGFGAIYRAQHIASGHEVAIKVLHPQLAADPNVIERFRREGATLSKLRAPHTVKTYEFGEAPDGMLYIVMELLEGVSLHERIRERRMLPWREALQIARAICISLAEAHALGIVHRDLKPANIHLETRGDADYVKVLDFGIAKIKRGASTDEQPELTNAGQMIGTIDYMAPEQILGGQPDGRSDIFTLGILMFEMIAGRRPFADSATPTSMLAALLTQVPPRLSKYTPVPAALDALVAKCLSREANDRYATVEELGEEMDRVLMTSSDDGQTRTIAIGLHTQNWADEEATLMADAHEHSVARPLPERLSRTTLESPAPPAPRHTPAPRLTPAQLTPPPQRTPAPQRTSLPPTPAPAPRTPTPLPLRAPLPPTPTPAPAPRTPTPLPLRAPLPPTPAPVQRRAHPPTPFPPYPAPEPAAPPRWQTPARQVIDPSAQARVDTSGWNVPQVGRPSGMDPSAWQQYAAASQRAPHIPNTPFGQVDHRNEPVTPAPKTYDPNRDAAVGRIIWIVALVILVALAIGITKALT